MTPTDMLLHIGQISGYNNEIATEKQTLGVNLSINISDVPPGASGYTGEKSIVKPQNNLQQASSLKIPSASLKNQQFLTPLMLR